MKKRYMTIIFLLAILTFSLLFCLTEAKAQCTIVLYDHINFDETREFLVISMSVEDLGDFTWTNGGGSVDNDASSVQLSPFCTAILYKDPNFEGDFEILTVSADRLGSFDQAVSSIQLFAPGGFLAPAVLDNFGNLYHGDREGAEDFNKKITREVTFGNNFVILVQFSGKGPSYVKLSDNASTLDPFETQTVTVYLNPPFEGEVDESKEIRFLDGNRIYSHFFSVSAMVFDTPDVILDSVLGTNGKVNVSAGKAFAFNVSTSAFLFPGSFFSRFQWQKVVGSDPPDANDWSSIETTTGQKSFTFSDPGDFTVYVRIKDNNRVKSEHLRINVTAWNRPTIADEPPDDVQPFDGTELDASHVSWIDGKYVGVAGETVRLKADGRTNNSDGSEFIDHYVWTLDGEEFTQDNPDEIFGLTPLTVDLNGTISVIVFTNYGIESDAQTFDMKIYEPIQVDAGGPYAGVPNSETALQGSINNLTAYGDNATADYQWRVSTEAGLQFDGDNDYVESESDIDLATQSFTVMAWVKRGRSSQNEWVITQGQSGTNVGLNFGFRSSDTFAFAFWDNDLNVSLDKVPEITDTQDWHHWVGTYDATTRERKVYVDGEERDSDTNVDNYQGTGKLIIGSRFGTQAYFQGSIDDVAIFDRALSPKEIEEFADSILSGNETDLVGYWAFDDGEGATATDSSPNGNHGTLINGPTWPARDTDVPTDSDGGATNVWTTSRDTVYSVEFEATLTTSEGIQLTGTDIATVTIGAGSPTATIGGPYFGGIDGGDHSPIQAVGNFPNTFETDTIGIDVMIEEWEWIFDKTVSYNQGVFFSGDDSVSFGNLSFNTGSGLTVSVWVNTGFSDGDIVVTANNAFSLGLNAAGKPFFKITTDNSTETATSDASIAGDGFWHHLIGVYDGEEIHLYLNGYLQESVEVSGTILDPGAVSIPSSFVGSVDDLSIWERAISAVERGVLGVGKAPNSFKLAGYWPFDEGGGTTVGNQESGGNDGTLSGSPDWTAKTLVTSDIYNPTQTYEKAGEYSVSLRVKADTERKSTTRETTVTIIDGSIAGTIRAADLRTPVSDVRLTLTSSFVLNGDLSSVVTAGTDINVDGSAIYTLTDVSGDYLFENLPLGSYRLVAAKVEVEGTVHEFENPILVAELTLSTPDRPATDFVDLSVFPVGGRIRSLPYDLEPDNPEVPDDDLLVSDVVIEANPIGSTSSVESDPSKSTADATNRNYSMPMFGGKYQFFARTGQDRSIALDSDTPGSELIYTDFDGGVTSAVRLVTITGATSQVHFTDSTKRTLTVEVEDSGGFPIQTIPDLADNDLVFGIDIKVNATLSGVGKTATNAVEAETDADGDLTRTLITFELPPGEYTIKVEDSFEGRDIVFRNDQENPDTLTQQIDVDLTLDDAEITMVVPIQIQLSFGERPNLLDIFDTNSDGVIDANDDFFELLTNQPTDDPPGFGLSSEEIMQLEEGLEGYIFYYTPDLQTHTYAIQATANGHPVENYTLAVTDHVSQLSDDGAAQQTLTISVLFDATLSDHESELNSGNISVGLKTLFSDEGVNLSDNATVKILAFPNDDGTAKWMITDGDNTYFLQADGDQLHVDFGTYEITGGLPAFDTQTPPNVVPKEIFFQALKDGYRASDTKMDSVTVLGDRLKGTAAQIVSIPNINYLVLHDPPGDGSYAFVEDDLIVKGIVSDMTIRPQGLSGADGLDQGLGVFPAPWSVERSIDGVDYDKTDDLEGKGLLGKRDFDNAETRFREGAAVESIIGAVVVGLGPIALVTQIIAASAIPLDFSPTDFGGDPGLSAFVQYEIRVNRHLQTPSGDSLHDLMGPGKGDIYFGEGWTLGFQERHRFGLTFDGTNWATETTEITTYDILDRTNQYIYTTRDIENIIEDLDGDIAGGSDLESDGLTAAQRTWLGLLEKNFAYQWSEFYIENADKLAELEAKESALSTLEQFQLGHLQTAETNIAAASDDTFEAFRKAMGLPEDSEEASRKQEVETLIFSAGPVFEYSRTIAERQLTSFSRDVGVHSEGRLEFGAKAEAGFGGTIFAVVTFVGVEGESKGLFAITTSANWAASAEAGVESEQTVGFVLQDDDIGDNIATRVYEDPIWGTPLFIHDLGSVTSDPWSPGTNKAVDLKIELIAGQLEFLFSPSFTDLDIDDLDDQTISTSLQTKFTNNSIDVSGAMVEIDRAGERWIINTPDKYIVRLERKADLTDILNVYQETVNNGPFDYHDGAHYTVRVTYTGQRVQSATVDFVIYAYPTSNTDSATARFNGDRGPYEIYLATTDSFADIEVSIYPPEIDQDNSFEREYSVVIEVDEIEDAPQIFRTLTLTPRFADLQPPTAEISAPYDGERISPAMFDDVDDTFTIKVITEDSDIETIRIQSRSKRQDGVWGNWSLLGGLSWTDGVDSQPTDLGGNPTRFRYTFELKSTDINNLGVGSYQLRALASDKAGNPEVEDNDLPTAPTIEFLVDASKPTVLTTIPNYQDSESERTYKGELSVVFTDDMTETDFTSDTFEVINLLESNAAQKQVSGFVSYSPALRKAIFVPEIPFDSNWFYKVTIKTEDEAGIGGVHDLAGNPLDNEFSWTFRTTDSLFEKTWELTFAVEAGSMRDGNNIAGVEVGEDVTDGDDERDAQAVPPLSSQLRMSFLHADLTEYDRDIRPADGRVFYYWFFVVDHGDMSDSPTEVTLLFKPSIEMTKAERDYQFTRLIEFEDDAVTVRRVTPLDLKLEEAVFDVSTGEFEEMTALTYTPAIGEQSRYFRLDVRKSADFVAQDFEPGTSSWLFLSVPITPQVAAPYVNLGDDLDSFQLYDYNTVDGGYHVYPLDLDRDFGLRAGRGYFTRIDAAVEIDVGGTSNLIDVEISLPDIGWYPIGNPFILPVNVADLDFSGNNFATAVSNGLIESVLYKWVKGQSATFKTAASGDATASELDTASLPTELNDEFTANALPLTSPTVEVVFAGSAWRIHDGDTFYDVAYNGNSFKINQNADFYQEVDVTGELTPWEGYWLKTKVAGLTLTILAPDGIADAEAELPISFTPPTAPPLAVNHGSEGTGGFNLRLALTSDFAADLTTVLGTHPDAELGRDGMDNPEPPTLGKTVSVYFPHRDWGDAKGRYNTDYQPPLKVGEARTWQFNVFTDRRDAEMTLSWGAALRNVPDDIMLHFRRLDGVQEIKRSTDETTEWIDMRELTAIHLTSTGRLTEIPLEVRAQRFAMEKPADVQVIAGEKQVEIRWNADDNPFIEDYTITRQLLSHPASRVTFPVDGSPFIDTDVEEEATYSYEVIVRFLTGAELHSELLTVTVLPVIKETVLRQNYPNPFNPETWLPYELAKDADVSLDIYSTRGQLVRSLNLGFQGRGRYVSREKAAYWDGRNNYGERVASGIYFYVMQAGDYVATRKMVILK